MTHILAQDFFRDLLQYGIVSSWEEFCILVTGQKSFNGTTLTLEDLEVTALALEAEFDVTRVLITEIYDILRHHRITIQSHI